MSKLIVLNAAGSRHRPLINSGIIIVMKQSDKCQYKNPITRSSAPMQVRPEARRSPRTCCYASRVHFCARSLGMPWAGPQSLSRETFIQIRSLCKRVVWVFGNLQATRNYSNFWSHTVTSFTLFEDVEMNVRPIFCSTSRFHMVMSPEISRRFPPMKINIQQANYLAISTMQTECLSQIANSILSAFPLGHVYSIQTAHNPVNIIVLWPRKILIILPSRCSSSERESLLTCAIK